MKKQQKQNETIREFETGVNNEYSKICIEKILIISICDLQWNPR